VSRYFDSLNRALREVAVVAVPRPAPPAHPAPSRTPRPLASGYGDLREKLLTLANGRPLKMLVFAGCVGGEGCSQVVREFAELLAGSGLNVLRIDADAHRRRGEASGADLVLALRPEPPPAIAVGAGCLTVLTSPAAIPDKERLFRAPEFRAWLEAQRDLYDYVLLDAPPLLTVADGTLLGALSDGLIIVAQSEATKNEALTRARERLQRGEVHILGVVLNRARDPVPPIVRHYLSFFRE